MPRLTASSSLSSVSLELDGHAYTGHVDADGHRFPRLSIVEDGRPAGALAYDPSNTPPFLGWVPAPGYAGPLASESSRERVATDLAALLAATGKGALLGIGRPVSIPA